MGDLTVAEVEAISYDSMIEVAVVSFCGRLGTLFASRGHSVDELKQMIKVTASIPVEHQILKCGLRFLGDPQEKPFETLDGRTTASLFVHIVEEPFSQMIEVTALGMAGHLGTFEACRFSTVAELRDKIAKKMQRPTAECLRLVINDAIFRDPCDQPLATLDAVEATIFVVGTQRPGMKDVSFHELGQQCAAILARIR